MKKILLGLAMIATLAIPSMGAQVLTGGNVPLVNNMVGVGAITLDFSGPGTLVELAAFIINNNSPDFDVTWTFTNTAQFKATTDFIAMTGLTVEKVPLAGGNFGMGGASTGSIAGYNVLDETDNVQIDILADVQADAATNWTVTGQTAATVNYKLSMKGSWADASTKLAGLYLETINFNIVASGL